MCVQARAHMCVCVCGSVATLSRVIYVCIYCHRHCERYCPAVSNTRSFRQRCLMPDRVPDGRVWHEKWYGMKGGTVWYGMKSGMVFYGMVWYGMAWYEKWYGMVWYGMVWYGMV